MRPPHTEGLAGILIASAVFGGCRNQPAPRPVEVKIASIQCSSELGAVDTNTRKLTALVEQAARNGAKIIVLPEAVITGYLSQNLKTNWHLPGRPIAAG